MSEKEKFYAFIKDRRLNIRGFVLSIIIAICMFRLFLLFLEGWRLLYLFWAFFGLMLVFAFLSFLLLSIPVKITCKLELHYIRSYMDKLKGEDKVLQDKIAMVERIKNG